MQYYILLFVSLAFAQNAVDLDPAELEKIFGKPLDEITVKPTEKPTEITDKFGNTCRCVPYYLCDTNLNAVNADNTTITGYGTLDIRFKEDDCQESAELCCKDPKREEDVVIPTPDPSKLKGCGYRNSKGLDFTIVGGTGRESQFGEFPWVVAILDAVNSTYYGVGVLIHPQVVLTGAHVVANHAAGSIKIRAGEWDTQTVKERLKYQERVAQDIYIHKDFAPRSLKNDMALLYLESPVELADHINVICLPEQDESFDNYKECLANGWGKDKFGQTGRYAVILKRVSQDMVAHDRCNSLLKRTRLGNNFRLHSSFVCAGGVAGQDTCQGDGGAPLACPIGDDRYKLTGLVAWGIGCGEQDVPAVYAAVARFRKWIDDKMAEWGLSTADYSV